MDHYSRSDRSKFWLNGSCPLTSITGETGLNYFWQARYHAKKSVLIFNYSSKILRALFAKSIYGIKFSSCRGSHLKKNSGVIIYAKYIVLMFNNCVTLLYITLTVCLENNRITEERIAK